jgi:hypothetical protein
MKTHKIKTKGHNQEIWDKMGRLFYARSKPEWFMKAPYIFISEIDWSWTDEIAAFKTSNYTKIGWKNFLRLPEPDPFKGKEYYIMLDNPKEIDYLLMIAEAREQMMEADYAGRHYYRQFVFNDSYRVGANITDNGTRGTKITLSQFINGTWSDEFIVGEYYRSDELVVKMQNNIDKILEILKNNCTSN